MHDLPRILRTQHACIHGACSSHPTWEGCWRRPTRDKFASPLEYARETTTNNANDHEKDKGHDNLVLKQKANTVKRNAQGM
eukprot:3691534-Pyramimonas_sp.AAC.1